MRFYASHVTEFRYSEPVLLEPHTIRLRPRSDSWQFLRSFRLQVEPRPSRLAESTDSEGNDVAHAWFGGPTDTLTIRTEFEVETLRADPFDYLLVGACADRLPVEYPPAERRQLDPALALSEPGASATAELARRVAGRARQCVVPFLGLLSEELRARCELVVREDGAPMRPGECLRSATASCRDLAALYVECCRSVGMAARFVSGYAGAGSQPSREHMHAWAEVYLPGGGWRGYDPSQGLAVADRHVAVAAAPDSAGAAPTSGAFRGDASAEPMRFEIRLRCEAAPGPAGSEDPR